VREAPAGLDADDSRDARRLETTPRVAEEGLHGGGVEPAGDLIRSRDGEVLAGGCEDAAGFEFFFERLALGFVRLERQVGVADRVGELFVAKIVEFRCDIVVDSLSHGSSPWFRLEPWQACPRLPGSHTLGYHKVMVKRNRPKMGRPATGKGLGVLVRFPDKELVALDEWIVRDGGLLSRPQAIRRLVLRGIGKSESKTQVGTAGAQKASRLAARAAEQIVDKSIPSEEQQHRKRALIKGPKEFRDIREDLPKRKS
jgi:hypothetical protein